MKRTIPIICAICMLLTGCTGLKLDNITSLLDRETPAPSDSPQASLQTSPQTSPQPVSRSLKLDENPELYTYADMENDLKILADTYQDVAHLQDLGVQTLDGRKLYDMVIGDPNAPRHVIVHASIHAREYITTKLVMRQMMDYLQNMKAGGTYNGMSYSEMSKSTALHIIPMVNPDGVTLSQMGLSGMQTQAASDRVKEVVGLDGKTPESTDFSQWKANANGVDLNRNYDAMWQEFEGSSHPSSDRYKGESPGSEPETKALIELTKKIR